MSDVADLTSSMIIRPGLKPVWLFVCSAAGLNTTAQLAAMSPKTFGDIRLQYDDPHACCGVIFVAETNGSLTSRALLELDFFFKRDRAEALVFEYDGWQKKFFARSWESLCNRCRETR